MTGQAITLDWFVQQGGSALCRVIVTMGAELSRLGGEQGLVIGFVPAMTACTLTCRFVREAGSQHLLDLGVALTAKFHLCRGEKRAEVRGVRVVATETVAIGCGGMYGPRVGTGALMTVTADLGISSDRSLFSRRVTGVALEHWMHRCLQEVLAGGSVGRVTGRTVDS